MDRGNVNPTQHLPWWLRETTKRTPISLVSTGIWTRNSPNTSPVWWISIGAMLSAFENFIMNRTSQSAAAGMRAFIFNCCNDTTVRTQNIPLVHVSSLYIHAVASCNKWFTICGTSGKLTCGLTSYAILNMSEGLPSSISFTPYFFSSFGFKTIPAEEKKNNIKFWISLFSTFKGTRKCRI